MKTLILYNPNKPEAIDAVPVIESLLSGFSEVVGKVTKVPPVIETDFIVVLGGDGTILRTIKDLVNKSIPVVGINFGKLGFMTTFQYEDIKPNERIGHSIIGRVEQVNELKSNYFKTAFTEPSISERTMIMGCIIKDGKRNVHMALNDFVINAGSPFRSISLKISIDGRELTTVNSDGLIVSTPTGSTAYNLSSNGPLMLPESAGIIINPLNPHALTYRPLVIHENASIKIEAVKVNKGTTIVVDGEEFAGMINGEILEIRTRPNIKAKLVRNPKRPIWCNLIEKLRWGV